MQEHNIKSNFLLDITDENIHSKNLIKREKDGCTLFKYDRNQEIDNINEINECRGIIISENRFVCLPPCKNMSNEDFFSKYDLNQCQQEEFIDGTMINIYWNNNKINYSTRSQIDAEDKNYGILNRSFKEMFNEVYSNYNFSLEDTLPKDVCLSCVLCHKENPIVKHHTENKIYLVEAKKILENHKYSNIQIYNPENLKGILFDKPDILSFNSLKDIHLFLENQDYQYKGIIIKNDNVKTKIEAPKYLEVKELRRLDIKNTKILYYTLKKNNQLRKFLKLFPNYNCQFEEYKKEYENLLDFLYKNYRMRWVIKKENRVTSISELKYECRPIIYELHKKYISNNIIITKNVINEYLIGLSIPSIFHTLKCLE